MAGHTVQMIRQHQDESQTRRERRLKDNHQVFMSQQGLSSLLQEAVGEEEANNSSCHHPLIQIGPVDAAIPSTLKSASRLPTDCPIVIFTKYLADQSHRDAKHKLKQAASTGFHVSNDTKSTNKFKNKSTKGITPAGLRKRKSRENTAYRLHEQQDDTLRRKRKRGDEEVRATEQQEDTLRRKRKRGDEEVRATEQQEDTLRRKKRRGDEAVRATELQEDTLRRKRKRTDEQVHAAEQEEDTRRRKSTRRNLSHVMQRQPSKDCVISVPQ